MKDYNYAIKNLETALSSLKKELADAKNITTNVLAECKKQGIKRVSIGKRTDKIESAKNWGSWGCQGSIFADERTKDGWPAIWRVAEATKIGGGCGNSGQYQVRQDANLMEGVYELKGNVWRKVE